MSLMFWTAHLFNQDISNWDTSKVRDAWLMSWGASAFEYAKLWDAKKNTKFYHLSH